jgi:hypothetical protein
MNNITRYIPIDDKNRILYYEFGLEYGEGHFILYNTSDYKNVAETFTIAYSKKNNWEIKSGVTFRKWTFPSSSSSNSKRWVYTFGLQKTFSSSLSFIFDLRKEWRDYYQGLTDKTYEVFRTSLIYKF